MKKLIVLLSFLALPSLAKADLFDFSRDKAMTVSYTITTAANSLSTTTLIIDLSDTTNWPHKETGAINICSIRLDTDKAAASTSTVKVGVVNFINTSTGSVTWFFNSGSALNVSNTNNKEICDLAEAPIRTKVAPASSNLPVDGATKYIMSSDKTSGSTSYQTDVYMQSPNGVVYPGLGDIVVDINKTYASAITYVITIVYFSEK